MILRIVCMTQRYKLTDEQWRLIEPYLPVQKRGGRWAGHRKVVDGIFWILFSGAPWRDLPRRYGSWQTAHRRLLRLRADGTWERLLDSLRVKADRDGLLDWSQWNADSTSIRAGRGAAGAKKKATPPATRHWA